MATDFSYGGKQIVASGPFRPSGKNIPVDARTRVNTYADISSIPTPFIGMRITVLADETNSDKMTDYIVKSLKANASGIADMAINEVVRYVDYLGVSSSSGGTSSGGNVDLTEYATKTYVDNSINTALDGHTFKFLTQAEYDVLPDEEKNNPTIEYHITDSNDSENIDTTNLASDLSLTGSSLQLKNSNGSLIGNSVNIPQKTSDLTNDSEFATTSYVDAQIAKIEISGGSSELANLIIII